MRSRRIVSNHEKKRGDTVLNLPLNAERVFPVVTHENYLRELGEGSYVAWDFGHDLVLMLWSDEGNVIQSVNPSQLTQLGLNEDEQWNLAFQNLNDVLNRSEIEFKALGFPGDQAVLVAGPHWLASALPMHGGLYGFISGQISASDICVAVPERGTAIFFSQTCSAEVRSAVEAIASDAAKSSLKPFGWRLFAYSEEGAVPI